MPQDISRLIQKRERLSFWIAVLSVVLAAAGVLFPIVFSPRHEITLKTTFRENTILIKIENTGDFNLDGSQFEDNDVLRVMQGNYSSPIHIPKIFNSKDFFEIEIPKISTKTDDLKIKGKIKNISSQNVKAISSNDIFIWENLSRIIYRVFLYFITLLLFLLALILGYTFAFPYHGNGTTLRNECFRDILDEMQGRTDYIKPFAIFYTLYNWSYSASVEGFGSWLQANRVHFFENLHLADNEYYFYLRLEKQSAGAKVTYIKALKDSNFLEKFISNNLEFEEILRQTEDFDHALINAYKKNKRKFKWCGALWNDVENKAKKLK